MIMAACTRLHPCFDPLTGTCPPCNPEGEARNGNDFKKAYEKMSEEQKEAYFERIFEASEKEK